MPGPGIVVDRAGASLAVLFGFVELRRRWPASRSRESGLLPLQTKAYTFILVFSVGEPLCVGRCY